LKVLTEVVKNSNPRIIENDVPWHSPRSAIQ